MNTIRISIALLVYFLCFTLYDANCQLEKGNMLLGGSIGFNNTKTKSPGFQNRDSFSFNFNPNIAYAVIDRLMLGVSVPVSFSKSTVGSQEFKTNEYSFGPRVRYYFHFGDLAIFPEASYTFGKTKLENPVFDITTGQTEDVTIRGDLTNFNTGIGLTYFLNHNIGIEGILSYNKRTSEYNSSFATDNDFSSINFNVGFQIYFQSRKNLD